MLSTIALVLGSASAQTQRQRWFCNQIQFGSSSYCGDNLNMGPLYVNCNDQQICYVYADNQATWYFYESNLRQAGQGSTTLYPYSGGEQASISCQNALEINVPGSCSTSGSSSGSTSCTTKKQTGWSSCFIYETIPAQKVAEVNRHRWNCSPLVRNGETPCANVVGTETVSAKLQCLGQNKDCMIALNGGENMKCTGGLNPEGTTYCNTMSVRCAGKTCQIWDKEVKENTNNGNNGGSNDNGKSNDNSNGNKDNGKNNKNNGKNNKNNGKNNKNNGKNNKNNERKGKGKR